MDEYLVDLNATQAAIRAGYSRASAGQLGHAQLKKLEIQEAIAERRKALSEATAITVERTLREAARLAFFDPRKLYHPDGTPKRVSELDDDTAAAIQGLEVAVVGNAEIGVGQVLKYKVADKNSALERIFKHLGLFEEDNTQQRPALPTQIQLVPLLPEPAVDSSREKAKN